MVSPRSTTDEVNLADPKTMMERTGECGVYR